MSDRRVDEAVDLVVGLLAEARRVGIDERQARRLAHRGAFGPWRRVGQTIIVGQGAVDEYVASRRAGKAAVGAA